MTQHINTETDTELSAPCPEIRSVYYTRSDLKLSHVLTTLSYQFLLVGNKAVDMLQRIIWHGFMTFISICICKCYRQQM